MDVIQQIGSAFYGLSRGIERSITKVFGSSNERRVRQIGFIREKDGTAKVVPGSILDRINQLESSFQSLSDDELRQSTSKFRAKLHAGQTLEQILPEVFAAVRESGRRYLRMRHFDVQMIGGYVLNKGMIAEMVTGEGKTLVATLPAYLNGLAGKVHVVTVNDYLARRDMEWMGPIYLGLGMTVGNIQSHMDPRERQKSYSCDLTYGTNNEFGFDYLRDNMKTSRDQQVQGRLDFALVDEIDNILIDEARTPLIISGFAYDSPQNYADADRVVRQLRKGEHFEVKEKEHACHLTEEGVRVAEKLAGVESFYIAGNLHWPHLLDNALKAHHLYKRDVNYVVERGDVIIIDEHTGRKMVGRQWSDGLHQAVEAKEGVKIKEETQTLATITLQNYFKLYKKLAGMTGTAMTEADEFLKIYKLDVINIPTNRPMKRINSPDVIYRSEREKWNAVLEEVQRVHAEGRPVLVGTVSIEKSEILHELLKPTGIKHELLNAKNHEREAEIIAQAGRVGAVTISTNMAGRGTDIVLGGNPEFLAWHELSKTYASRLDVSKVVWDETTARIAQEQGMADEGRKVAELGGLHVIGTERHDSRRIDLQLRGRAGRQGDPGSSRFFISLDDDLMRIFMGEWVRNLLTSLGMQEGEAIESRMVTNRIEAAQKKREEAHFDMRKHLLEYDEVMDTQRKEIYTLRQLVLEGMSCRPSMVQFIERQIERMARRFLDKNFVWDTVTRWAEQVFHVEFEQRSIKGMGEELLDAYIREEARRQADEGIEEQMETHLPQDTEESDWNWGALTQWVNSSYGLELKTPELKALPREELRIHLYTQACESIEKYDLSMISQFLAPDFAQRGLSQALQRQFGVEMDPAKLQGMELDFALPVIRDEVVNYYRHKEVEFPIQVGFQRFFTQDGPESLSVDAAGMIAWTTARFGMNLTVEELPNLPYQELMKRLFEGSENYLAQGDSIRELDTRSDSVFGERQAGKESRFDGVKNSGAIPAVIDWANSTFAAELEADDFENVTRERFQQMVMKAYDRRFRPELHQVERYLILDFLDTAWKEHLHFMDRLRSSVNLQSFAQKDPKTEYSREGMKAFEAMKERIGEQITGTVFHVEQNLSPESITSLSRVTSETHPEVAPSMPQPPAPAPREAPRTIESSGKPEEAPPAVEPIRNRTGRVGRNDPCPCGSGRKYKKCCGENL